MGCGELRRPHGLWRLHGLQRPDSIFSGDPTHRGDHVGCGDPEGCGDPVDSPQPTRSPRCVGGRLSPSGRHKRPGSPHPMKSPQPTSSPGCLGSPGPLEPPPTTNSPPPREAPRGPAPRHREAPAMLPSGPRRPNDAPRGPNNAPRTPGGEAPGVPGGRMPCLRLGRCDNAERRGPAPIRRIGPRPRPTTRPQAPEPGNEFSPESDLWAPIIGQATNWSNVEQPRATSQWSASGKRAPQLLIPPSGAVPSVRPAAPFQAVASGGRPRACVPNARGMAPAPNTGRETRNDVFLGACAGNVAQGLDCLPLGPLPVPPGATARALFGGVAHKSCDKLQSLPK